ncbi:PLP-dependent aminotransferase family protein [Halomonas sp. EGI 63088]|uniref:PLP-dependent aminotransferase family protein n=1 Tax=Halomonas flagellata TaxID=2920385 RepID=A0ABS9RPA8_9GAMM|nr:PLP-dependent aminotransferase family protein [Halomonas flagellata]MCH4561824.1 PLP-dependent aminotransferase family protein [Halomonas flagellata]
MTIWTPQLTDQGPRYRGIAEAIAGAILAGDLAPGERLPPQRRLADELGVTVGTVTRAYAEAERQGWVEARVGSGTYVRDDTAPGRVAFMADRRVEDGMIDLSLSLPPPHPLRADALGRALRGIAADAELLQRAVAYQSERGVPAHREQLAAWMTRLGMATDPAALLVTQGGQHGISLALQALTRPGERIAADALTYPGLIGAARQAHLKVLGVPLTESGMDLDALARLCAQQPPRLVYVTPDQNNPTAAVLSEAKRERLAELARRHDFWILEDGVQYLPEAERGTPLHRLAPERTLFIFSTSKVLAGGLRIGTLAVPEPLQDRLCTALRAQSWMVPPLMVEAVCRWAASDEGDRLLAWQTEELGARQRLAHERLAAFSPRGRDHGANLWLPLTGELRSAELLEVLEQRGVRLNSAEPFCVGSEPAPQALRLCLSAAASREALARALEIVAEALHEPPPRPWRTL